MQWLKRSDLHDAVIQTAARHVEKELKAAGLGSAPSPYSLIWFGSGGRGELTHWSDQDHGLIYKLPSDKKAIQHAIEYFTQFSTRLVELLVLLNYPICPGLVLASNPRWRNTVEGWKLSIDQWLETPNWDNIRYCVILSDMRHVAGDKRLSDELKIYLYKQIKLDWVIDKIRSNSLHIKTTIGLWGQLLTQPYGDGYGCIDIKYGGYLGLVKNIRLWSIALGIPEVSTFARIDRVAALAGWEEDWKEELKAALSDFLYYRNYMTIQDSQESGGRYMPVETLHPDQLLRIKHRLKTVKQLQKITFKRFAHPL